MLSMETHIVQNWAEAQPLHVCAVWTHVRDLKPFWEHLTLVWIPLPPGWWAWVTIPFWHVLQVSDVVGT